MTKGQRNASTSSSSSSFSLAKDCTQAMESMRAKLEVLQHEVQSLQAQLLHERLERESFQNQVRKRLRNVLADFVTTGNSDQPILQQGQARSFDDVTSLLDAAESTSNSVSSTSQHTPTATTPKDGHPYISDAICDNAEKVTFPGFADLSSASNQLTSSNADLNTRLTTPYPQGVLPSVISKDFEQNSLGEDITSLINDAMAQNLRKRTLSNDFILAHPQKARRGSGQQQSNSFDLTPNISRQFPLLPLRHNTPATPMIISSNGLPTPSSQLDERDILEKWGIQFSEKYATISEVWNEYHKVGSKGVSIRSLESSFSTRWRANLRKNVKKKYSRRLIIIRAIETGMKRGKTLNECIAVLDAYLTDAKKPVSYLYRKANLPADFT
ncbi:LAME_0F09054g1_1 [Lachancea meyersii CBS 8951]|uniref:LAME_0F09054g1_1 n=1 Tax=Lachancea meyersii CBS 8951 TaxID=1266667 RepID=A0A1G4JUT3_9SACH|nr:LAME_0F09054g1_1 [Lachancea meyersii CBS 8951]